MLLKNGETSSSGDGQAPQSAPGPRTAQSPHNATPLVTGSQNGNLLVSREEAALEVLMSICLSVVKLELKFT